MERVFLNWNAGLLPRVAEWLIEQFGPDMDGVVVALPGARAGRNLQELLARGLDANLRPPLVLTVGVLSDELLKVEGAAAGRLVRTLAWERALRELTEDQLSTLIARPPAADDRQAWSALAEEVRGLFGEIAAEGLDFEKVAGSSILEQLPGEIARWRTLGAAQRSMVRCLEDVGLHDPHLGRLAAIDAERVRTPRHVVLVGAVEMNALLRSALTACQSTQTSLVLAPEAEADRFDAFGCLVPERWTTRTCSLALDHWHVVDRPADQAQAAMRVMAGWNAEYRAEEISIGLADAEVSPYVKTRLAEAGIRARDAAGVAMARTAAVRLLTVMATFTRTRSFRDLAILVRHPDFEAAMRRIDPKLEPLATLDQYHGSHLPWRADGEWCANGTDEHDLALRRRMHTLWETVRTLAGELLDAEAAPVREQAAIQRRFLEQVYAGCDLDPGEEGDRLLVASLRCLAQGLEELESLPENLAPSGPMADSIDLLLRLASTRSNDVPPAAARAEEPTIEMMGWLELPLDDAPALIVTGFQDGKVPESVRGDAYLPNRLRRDLGLVDNEKRLARDLYATELLVHSRAQVAFITGRRNMAGDPQIPSRVLFHCEESDVAARVRRFLSGHSANTARVESSDDKARALPRGTPVETPEEISVSAFKTFLDSPYAYYLKHVLKLKTLDDRAQEMDGAAFGNLAHEVLQRFGQDESAREEHDAERITAFLSDTLRDLGTAVYGRRPLPAIQLQLAQLEFRLGAFAAKQAIRRANGWRIHAVEWEPSGGSIAFPVDGKPIQLRGRIDRIDKHEASGAWAIWDYKTGEIVKKPLNAHRKAGGTWIDLQLPLYTYLVTELIGDAKPEELGYIAVGRERRNVGFLDVGDWRKPKDDGADSDEALASGLAVAADIVRRIRAGDFFELDGWQPYDEVFAAIGGVGLVGLSAAADVEDAQ
ncbi:MAG: ATP-dependent helicase/nuclease subunit B [Gammaproteobacteria bacterium]|jgi:ATP-dependent helicase/nuclease subunit B